MTKLTGVNKGDATSGGATLLAVLSICWALFVPSRVYEVQIRQLKAENRQLRNNLALVCNTLGAQHIFVPYLVETEQSKTNQDQTTNNEN